MKRAMLCLFTFTMALSLFPLLPPLVKGTGTGLFYQVLMGCGLWVFLFFAYSRKNISFATPSPEAICFFAFLAGSFLITLYHQRTAPWYVMQVVLAALFVWALLSIPPPPAADVKKYVAYPAVCLLCLETAVAYVQLGTALVNGRPLISVTGTFDNNAGLATALLLLYILSLLFFHTRKAPSNRTRNGQWIWGVTGVLALLLLLIIFSRAALLACLAVTVFFFVRNGCINLQKRKPWLYIPATLLFFTLCTMAYLAKQKSADGRLPVWHRTLEMIADAPLTGYGHEGFTAHYMERQAAFFAAHPDSPQVLTADNMTYPMNEGLRLMAEYGVPVFVLLLLCTGRALWKSRKNKGTDRQAAQMWLLGIGTMSLFAYPLTLPFVQFTTLTALSVLFRSNNTKAVHGHPKARRLLQLSGCAAALTVMGSVFYMYAQERKWALAYNTFEKRPSVKALSLYETAGNALGKKPAFLYNYAAACARVGNFERSDSLLTLYRKWNWNSESVLLAADNALAQGRYSKVEALLHEAQHMVPTRFAPLYRLMLLYQMRGAHEEARCVAKEIILKPVKIPSPEVSLMREEAQKVLSCNRQH